MILPSCRRPRRLLWPAFGLLAGALSAAVPLLPDFDPQEWVPPPPAFGEAEDQADRRATAAVFAGHTVADEARGRAEAHVTAFDFAGVLGDGFQAAALPRTAALFVRVETEARRIAGQAKATWRRSRPRAGDPSRALEAGDPAKSPGYPSGHSTRGTLYALLLAELFPARRTELLARGREIGWTRVAIGAHTPLDIQAGRVLGQAIAYALLANPEFRTELGTVRHECETLTSGAVPER